MLVQGSKYSQSFLTVMLTKTNSAVFETIDFLNLPVFAIFYVDMLINVLFHKRLTLNKAFQIYNNILLLFIFITLSNFQKWYILWLLPSLIWQNRKMRRWIIYLSITAILPSFQYFIVEGDPYDLGIFYSVKIMITATILLGIHTIMNHRKTVLSHFFKKIDQND